MNKVLVKSIKQNYPVFVGSDTLPILPELISEYDLPKRIFVILDRNMKQYFGNKIKRTINAVAEKIHYSVVTASEKNKSLDATTKIYSALYKQQFGRDTLIISIGGGTIGDLAGFIASTYMRGVPLVHIPTTFLSMVDSSIGSKTSVNFREAKNLIGSFNSPSFVLIDIGFLKTLPQKEIISGFGEVIKYSYLTDKTLYNKLLSDFHLLKKLNLKFINEIILQCIKIKSAVVSVDEFEKSGLRKILNFGHTFAHAYESISNYKISHGKAVIIGILNALYLSYELGFINQNKLDKMIELPLKFKAELKSTKFDGEDILRSMRYDKKNKEGQNRFVLIKDFGEILVDVRANKKAVLKVLNKTNKILV
ncbi:MAG: 3-dehydroquinate synthase [bacterium]|nr:3-dehydroquinate synthase [bacterium]